VAAASVVGMWALYEFSKSSAFHDRIDGSGNNVLIPKDLQ
jgi:hypothetical protein